MRDKFVRYSIFFLLVVTVATVGGCDKKERKNPFEDRNGTETALTQELAASHRSPLSSDAENYILHTSDEEIRLVSDMDGAVVDPETPDKLLCLAIVRSDSLPAVAQLPYLSDLQERFDTLLRCIVLLVDPDIDDTALATLREKAPKLTFAYGKETIRFVVTVTEALQYLHRIPVPMLLIYADGTLRKAYKTAVPYEMLEHDIATMIHKGETP